MEVNSRTHVNLISYKMCHESISVYDIYENMGMKSSYTLVSHPVSKQWRIASTLLIDFKRI